MNRPLLLSLWEKALSSDHGIIIPTSDSDLLRQRLFRIKKEENISFSGKIVIISATKLVILKEREDAR